MVYEQLHADKTMLHSLLARVFWLDAKLGARCLKRRAFSDINLLPVGGFPEQAMGLPCNASSGRSPDPYIVFEAVEFQQNDQS